MKMCLVSSSSLMHRCWLLPLSRIRSQQKAQGSQHTHKQPGSPHPDPMAALYLVPSISALSRRKVNVLLCCTDLCTDQERRSAVWQSWIKGQPPSPEGQAALRRKYRQATALNTPGCDRTFWLYLLFMSAAEEQTLEAINQAACGFIHKNRIMIHRHWMNPEPENWGRVWSHHYTSDHITLQWF